MGEEIVTLAHDFKRGPQTIRRIRQRIEKEGSGWYLKPAKKGRKPGATNPNGGRRPPQRKILPGEKKRIRKQLEKKGVFDQAKESGTDGEIRIDLEKFRTLLKEELDFYPLKKVMRALLDEWGKGVCRKELMKMEKHSGIEIMTYVILDTHCFAVVRFSAREKWLERFAGGSKFENEEAVLAYAKLRFHDEANNVISQKERRLSGVPRVKFFDDLKHSFCDLSLSVKVFKEAVTRVMNERAGKTGPFWEERFGSKRLHTPEDLVKAGIRVDGWAGVQGLLIEEPPEAYPWCRFAEAVGGSKRIRKGLCRIMGISRDRWKVSTKIEGFGRKGLPGNLYRKRLRQGED